MKIKIDTDLHTIFTEKLDQQCTLAEVIPVAVYLNIKTVGKRRNQLCEEINEKVGSDIYQFTEKNVWMKTSKAKTYLASIMKVLDSEKRIILD